MTSQNQFKQRPSGLAHMLQSVLSFVRRFFPALNMPQMKKMMSLIDGGLIICSAYMAWQFTHPGSEILSRCTTLALSAAIVFAIIHARNRHSYRGGGVLSLLKQILHDWMVTLALGAMWLFATKSNTEFSRAWIGMWALLSAASLASMRVLGHTVLRYLRSQGFNYQRVAVVGTGATLSYLLSHMGPARWTGYRMVDFIDPRDTLKIEQRSTDPDINEIWLCLPQANEPLLGQVMHALRFSAKHIRYVPDVFTYNLLNLEVNLVSGVPMIDLGSSGIHSGWALLVKGLFDRLLGAAILVLISPLMLVIALGIKMGSPGPVFFKQKRHGWNGDVIEVWKFRSMKVHAEHGTVTQATLGDPRVTRFGAFLRRTSLDELPQFINVLQGQMSIIGPRPHAIEHNERYKHLVPGYMLRHKVKPGITGWAQVNGLRGETDTLDKMQRRIEHDLFYITHWTLWLDLKIFLGTIFKGFVGKNAY